MRIHSDQGATMSDESRSNQWRSLIKNLSHDDPEQLLASPLNWRIHEGNQQAAMEAALTEIGWAGCVIVNDTTGNVVDGHMRVQLALRAGEATVPVLHLEATEEQEQLLLATYDPIGALAVADREKLKELTAGVAPEQQALKTMLEDLALRYRDGQVSESFTNFLSNSENTGEDDDTGNEPIDDGLGGESDGDDEESFFPVSFSMTGDQRSDVLGAIRKARKAFEVSTSAEGLALICRAYLDTEKA
jgi:hypothetical protein